VADGTVAEGQCAGVVEAAAGVGRPAIPNRQRLEGHTDASGDGEHPFSGTDWGGSRLHDGRVGILPLDGQTFVHGDAGFGIGASRDRQRVPVEGRRRGDGRLDTHIVTAAGAHRPGRGRRDFGRDGQAQGQAHQQGEMLQPELGPAGRVRRSRQGLRHCGVLPQQIVDAPVEPRTAGSTSWNQWVYGSVKRGSDVGGE